MDQGKAKKILIAGSCLIILSGILILPYLVNYYFSPDKLIANTLHAIETLTGTSITIGQARISLIDGMTLHDVQVFLPSEKMALEPRFDSDDARLLSAQTLHVTLRRDGLFGLKFKLGQIIVTQPVFHLTRLTDDNLWNWQMILAGKYDEDAPRPVLKLGPPIHVNQGQILYSEIDNGQKKLLHEIGFDAQALPKFPQKTYQLSLTTWMPDAPGPSATIDWNPQSGEIAAGEIRELDLDRIKALLPKSYQQWLTRLNLTGRIGIPEIYHHPDEKTKILVTLQNVNSKLPLSAAEFNHPLEKSWLTVSGMSGDLIITEDQVIVTRLTGKLNDAPCRIKGTLAGLGGDPENLSFNLHAVAQNFPLLDYTDKKQRDYIETHLPWALSCFYRDFKPRGTIDLDLLVSKNAGPEPKVVLTGTFEPVSLSTEYFRFPYRLDQLTGKIRVTENAFQLIDLSGLSGSSRTTINGTISEPSSRAGIDLTIQTSQAQLDEKLFNALPQRYKEIWNLFDLGGLADSHVRLIRPHGIDQPWRRIFNISLIDASACYEKFPYPLENLTGSLIYADGQLNLDNLVGFNGPSKVTLNGTARHLDHPVPTIDLQIDAVDVSVNDRTIDMLPEQTAGVLRDCQLSGTADLTGILKTSSEMPMQYYFLCDLKNGRLRYKEFPYPVENMTGQIIIMPRSVVINGIYAANDRETINGTGNITFSEDENKISLNIQAANIDVDARLYNALNPSQRTVWDLVNPTGTIDVQANLERRQDDPWDWNLQVDLKNAAVQYENLPPVNELGGDLLLTPTRIVLNDLAGLLPNRGFVETGGLISINDDETITVHLDKLNIQKMEIDRGTLELLKDTRIVKDLNWQPGGTLSSRLDRVEIKVDPEKKQTWDLSGTLLFNDVSIDAFDREPTDVRYRGNLTWNIPTHDFAINGNLLLSCYNWNDRKITDLQSNLFKDANESTLAFDQLTGHYADGQISGMGQLTFEPLATTYGLQLILNGIDAATALAVNNSKSSMQGTMRGEIYMLGTVGDKFIKRGGGVLQIDHAEALKVPLMARIFQNVSSEPMNLGSFHDISIKFFLEKHMVNLLDIRLINPVMSFMGTGTLNLSNDRVSLDLIAANPKHFDKVPLLPELIQTASKEISEIRVQGTIEDPVITVRPLKNLSNTLRTLLEGE